MQRLIQVIFLLTLGCQTLADPKPNVLFIAIDDLNDWIGCLGGHPQAQTPSIDRLANRGVLFTNAHCVAPACNPSRAAIFSGRLPSVTGVWSNQSGSLEQQFPSAYLLSTAFAKSGYQTFGTGKLLHSGGKESFDQYFTVNQRWSPLDKGSVKYLPHELPSKGTSHPRHITSDRQGNRVVLPLNRMPSDRKPTLRDGESFDWGPFDVPDHDFGDTQITDWAIQQLEKPSPDPLFLAVGYYRPHIPLWAPQRFFDRFKKSPGQLPPYRPDDLEDVGARAKQWAREAVTAGAHATVVNHQQWQAAVEAYLACVTYVDTEIGRLLEALDQSSHRDHTIVVLWSDHGWHLGEKDHWGKWTGWERSTRVPLIVVPSREQESLYAIGKRCHQPVSLLDLFPTLVDLCGLEVPDPLDGQSLIPLLQAPNKPNRRGVVTYFNPGNVSLRTDQWRYIRYQDGSEEIYDLNRDPNEWNNLIHHPSAVRPQQMLIDRLERILASSKLN